MKNVLLILVLCVVLPLYPQATDRLVAGQVTDVWETPIVDVNVLVKGTDRGVQTNEEGRFSLNADTGEVLVFSAVGYGNVEIEILDIDETFKIILSPRTTKLKEVVVEENKRKTKEDLMIEYPTNKNLIKTTLGILDKDRSSTALEILDGENLLAAGPDFLATLKNFHPNMRVVRPPFANDVEVYLRDFSYGSMTPDTVPGIGKPKAIFDVDGFVQEAAPTYLSGGDIDRVAILERNAAVNRYGPRGVGGVIIINTKGKNELDALGYGKDYTTADVRNSMNSLFDEADYVPAIPEYMEAFGSVTSAQGAMELFQMNKGDHKADSYFLMDMAYYFRERWKDEKEANTILKEVHEGFSQNIPALRGLAYRYDMLGKHDKALEIYLEVLGQDPLSAQSYCDVARTYAERMNYKKASKVYEDYQAMRSKGSLSFDAYGTDLFMTTDSYGYLRSDKARPNWERIGKEMGGDISRTRIALSWNNPDVKIGFQLVDPESSYKTWEVKSHDNETDRGYASTQFFLNEEVEGEWLLNLLYYESEGQIPTYLRITSFFNYGLPTQREETRVLKLTQEYEGNGLVKINTSVGTLGK